MPTDEEEEEEEVAVGVGCREHGFLAGAQPVLGRDLSCGRPSGSSRSLLGARIEYVR
jgi:hypothetical protein